MRTYRRPAVLGVSLLALGMAAGCAAPERAWVDFSYVVEPSRGLPEGMKTLAIMPAKVGPTTDAKWSDMCATIMRSLVDESRNSFGTDIEVSDRRDTQVTFDEADLAAAGMSTATGGQGGRLLAAQGAILSNINVKVEKHVGCQRTLAGLSLGGGGGRHFGFGGTDIRTKEVQTVLRNITVQTDFKLIDTSNNKVWLEYSPRPCCKRDQTKANPIFGSSKTEAELTPRDTIIAALVEREAREFISQLMPCRIAVGAQVESSRNGDCMHGVRMLRAEAFDDALSSFEAALAAKPDDHRAAYGAGVACEASGRYDGALRFYNQACAGKDEPDYRNARDRVKVYASRVRG